MTALPEPLTTSADDISGFDGFMLDTDRMISSELWALATGDEFKAAVGLWCRAWKQTPAGSLPDDERVLAAFSGAGPKWRKVRDVALRGFVKCSDGRLYHTFLCADVRRAAAKKSERNDQTKAATEARKRKRDEQRNDEREDADKPNVTESHRQDLSGTREIEETSKIPPTPDLDLAVTAWNEVADLAKLPRVQRLTEPRARSLKARLSECGGLEGWRIAIAKVRDSPFLRGQNDNGWKADFDFILQAKSFTKLMEGSYDSRTPVANGTAKQPRSFVDEALDTLGVEGHQGAEPSRE